MQAYVEPEWMKTKPDNSEELNSDDKNEEFPTNNESMSDGDSDSQNEEFYCIVCDKAFKTDKAFKNHEKSKKHKENLVHMKQHMKEEDIQLFFDKNDLNQEGVELENTEEKTKNR
jgi:DnaJ family protein A protein 5